MAKIKIETPHPHYSALLDQWSRCRDAMNGQDSVKTAKAKKGSRSLGDKYLPRLPAQTDDEYKAYLMRALWFNASGRTRDGLAGLIFAKNPHIDGVGPDDEFLDDMDCEETSLNEFAESLTEEVLGVGRVGVLVDNPNTPDHVKSAADAEAEGIRPYATIYAAENIINWKTGRVANRTKLVQVVLREPYTWPDGTQDVQYRELRLDPIAVPNQNDGQAWTYTVNIWRRPQEDLEAIQKLAQQVRESNGSGNFNPNLRDFEIVPDEFVIPLAQGRRVSQIPFWFINARDTKTNPGKPPLLDLVDVNFSHYRTMADLEHGRFFCGLPTPVFSGFNFDEHSLIKLGSMAGIEGPAGARAEYLEFRGDGLQALERAAEQKQLMIARLGSRILQEDKRAVEAAETLQIRTSAENSVLASIAHAISRALSEVVEFMLFWRDGVENPEVSFQLNTEYTPAKMDGPTMVAYLQAVQSGEMPRQDFFAALQQGQMIAPDRSFEDWVADLPEPTAGFSFPPKAPTTR